MVSTAHQAAQDRVNHVQVPSLPLEQEVLALRLALVLLRFVRFLAVVVVQAPSRPRHQARDHVQVALVAAEEEAALAVAAVVSAAVPQVVVPAAQDDRSLTEDHEVVDLRFKKMVRESTAKFELRKFELSMMTERCWEFFRHSKR